MQPPPVPFQLSRGRPAPVQQSGTTCGAASLTVARMLADPAFAAPLLSSAAAGGEGVAGEVDLARFAASEQVVLSRTNSVRSAGGRLNVPWPRALGTSPLGARLELETLPSAGGTAYRVAVVRWQREAALRRSYAAVSCAVGAGLPVLLYVGDALLPRHVVLAHRGTGGAVDVYDPATGLVAPLDQDAYARRRLRLAGWDMPWLVLLPRSAG